MSANFATLKEAARGTLQDLTNVGKIETRTGGIPTWIERPRPKQAFWEIGIVSATEQDSGVGPQFFEDVTIRIEGAMPFDYAANTEAVWDTLLQAMKDALRNNPCLKISGVASIRDSGRPQLVTNGLRTFSDGAKEVRVHHAVIEVRCRGWYVYSPT